MKIDGKFSEPHELATRVGQELSIRRKPFAWMRALVSVTLIVSLTGCAMRPRPKALLPTVNIPLECASSIRLVGCDLSFSPPHCQNVAVDYRKGCEQVVGNKD